jgi:hypothetical protein
MTQALTNASASHWRQQRAESTKMDIGLEVVLSAADVQLAADFYGALGWRVAPADFGDGGFLVVKLTPLDSPEDRSSRARWADPAGDPDWPIASATLKSGPVRSRHPAAIQAPGRDPGPVHVRHRQYDDLKLHVHDCCSIPDAGSRGTRETAQCLVQARAAARAANLDAGSSLAGCFAEAPDRQQGVSSWPRARHLKERS